MSILKDSLAGRIADWGAGAGPASQPALPVEGRSYLRGGMRPALAHITLTRLLAAAVAQFGPREALVLPASQSGRGKRLSFYDLDRAVDEIASGLLALGLVRGEVLALQAGGAEALVLRLAIARAGLVLAELSPELDAEDVLAALRDSNARVLVPGAATPLRTLLPELDVSFPGQLSAPDLPALRGVLSLDDAAAPDGALRLSALRDMAGPAQQLRLPGIEAQTDPDDSALILYDPQHPTGLVYSHYALVNAARAIAALSGLSETDRLALCLPGGAGFLTGLLPALAAGAALIPCAPETLASVLDAERCTALRSRSVDMAALREGPRLPSLRLLLPVGPLKEAGPQGVAQPLLTFALPGGLPLCLSPQGGWIAPHLEAKIVGATGRILPLGKRGRLFIRGYAVPQGCWSGAGTGLRDGWSDTGLDGVFGPDGRLNLSEAQFSN